MDVRFRRRFQSVIADTLQISSFFGWTISTFAGLATFAIGYLTSVPWFWVAVGVPVAFATTLYVSSRSKRGDGGAGAENLSQSSDVERVAVEDEKIHYIKTGDRIEIIRQRTRWMTHDTGENVRDILKEHAKQTATGKVAPTVASVKFDPEKMELYRATAVSSIVKHGDGNFGITFSTPIREPQFTTSTPGLSSTITSTTTATIVASGHPSLIEVRFSDAQLSFSGALDTEHKHSGDDEEEDTAFELGYYQESFRSSPTRDNALRLLVHLRKAGVVIRNDSANLLFSSHLDAWSRRIEAWTKQVVAALRAVSDADAEWLQTLDIVPAARVPIPNVRLGGDFDRQAFTLAFRMHDCRLARLNDLLIKYGVGA